MRPVWVWSAAVALAGSGCVVVAVAGWSPLGCGLARGGRVMAGAGVIDPLVLACVPMCCPRGAWRAAGRSWLPLSGSRFRVVVSTPEMPPGISVFPLCLRCVPHVIPEPGPYG